MNPLLIVAVSGSLRARSSNTILLEAARTLATPRMRIEFFTRLGDLPHFNPDLDGPELPAPVVELRQMLASADGLLISSPEYAHGVPGVLKNGLDWLVSSIEVVAMPVLLLNTSPRATHAQESLAETLRTMSAEVVGGASFGVPLAGRSFDVPGILADTERGGRLQPALDAMEEASLHSRAAGRRLVPRISS